MSKNESLLLDELVRIDYIDGNRNSLTFYIPNDIKIRRCRFKSDNLTNIFCRTIDIGSDEDLVIKGLGFIKIVAPCKINMYINKDISVYTRKNMI